jgi:hypothetical protein
MTKVILKSGIRRVYVEIEPIAVSTRAATIVIGFAVLNCYIIGIVAPDTDRSCRKGIASPVTIRNTSLDNGSVYLP